MSKHDVRCKSAMLAVYFHSIYKFVLATASRVSGAIRLVIISVSLDEG